jgi:hypothetical protein
LRFSKGETLPQAYVPEPEGKSKSLPELQAQLDELEIRYRLHVGELAEAQHRLEMLTRKMLREQEQNPRS